MGLPAKWRDAGRSGLISRADVRCVMGRIRNVARAGQYMYDSSEQKRPSCDCLLQWINLLRQWIQPRMEF